MREDLTNLIRLKQNRHREKTHGACSFACFPYRHSGGSAEKQALPAAIPPSVIEGGRICLLKSRTKGVPNGIDPFETEHIIA